eukprot:jgi/Botrbrau1/6402/Bobra.49_1s0019.1
MSTACVLGIFNLLIIAFQVQGVSAATFLGVIACSCWLCQSSFFWQTKKVRCGVRLGQASVFILNKQISVMLASSTPSMLILASRLPRATEITHKRHARCQAFSLQALTSVKGGVLLPTRRARKWVERWNITTDKEVRTGFTLYF